jgi:large subunit ribosomal protein L14e
VTENRGQGENLQSLIQVSKTRTIRNWSTKNSHVSEKHFRAFQSAFQFSLLVAMALFTRFVEVGRVGLINYGPDEGKLCTILDVIDQNRVLVDGPSTLTGVQRQVLTLKRISLTDLKVPLDGPSPRLHYLTKKFREADILAKWNKSAWAKKRAARTAKANLTDFERFKLYRYKHKVRCILLPSFLSLLLCIFICFW